MKLDVRGEAGDYFEPKTKLDPVAYTLRKRRYDLNISLNALSERLGYTAATIRKWECGEHVPNYIHLRNWCEALGYELNISEKQDEPA